MPDIDIYQNVVDSANNKNKYDYRSALNAISYPNNPLLLDEDWLFLNIEIIFTYGDSCYSKYHGFKEYYAFFRVLTRKYNLVDDYLYESKEFFENKWKRFVVHFIGFMVARKDGVTQLLFQQDDIVSYFASLVCILTVEEVVKFGRIGLKALFCQDSFINYFKNNPLFLAEVIEHYKIGFMHLNIPKEVFYSDGMKEVTNNLNVEDFYRNLESIFPYSTGLHLIDMHKRFCQSEIEGVKDGILPSLFEEYEKADEVIEYDSLYGNNHLRFQVQRRIFERNKTNNLPKKFFYQELSKYILIGLIMSILFETSPYNLLIDIADLVLFAKNNNKRLKGIQIYEFILGFEDKSFDSILSFYYKVRETDVKTILYDDYLEQKNMMIEDINASLIDPRDLKQTACIDGVAIYDISDIDGNILANSTNVPLRSKEKAEKLLDGIKVGDVTSVCLSLQGKYVNSFIEKGVVMPLKLAYGPLNPDYVGIVFHEDAYSIDINHSESDWYTRSLYTAKQLLRETKDYNEIVYLVDGHPFFPIAVISEVEIIREEIDVAKMLKIPIFFRCKVTKQETVHDLNATRSYRRYSGNMKLF